MYSKGKPTETALHYHGYFKEISMHFKQFPLTYLFEHSNPVLLSISVSISIKRVIHIELGNSGISRYATPGISQGGAISPLESGYRLRWWRSNRCIMHGSYNYLINFIIQAVNPIKTKNMLFFMKYKIPQFNVVKWNHEMKSWNEITS